MTHYGKRISQRASERIWMTVGFKKGPGEDLSCARGGRWAPESKRHTPGRGMSPCDIQNRNVWCERLCLDLKK